jgi:predicted alpha/beta hydrolase
MLQAMHGRRVRFSAADGFALGGVVAAADEKLRRAAVVIVAPGDTLESYDSLTVALGKAGWAVVLMEVRGSGWSAAPACPSTSRGWGARTRCSTCARATCATRCAPFRSRRRSTPRATWSPASA